MKRKGQPLVSSHWLVGSDSVRAVQSGGRTVSRDASCPTPNQNPASTQRYMKDKENTEKKREKKTQNKRDPR